MEKNLVEGSVDIAIEASVFRLRETARQCELAVARAPSRKEPEQKILKPLQPQRLTQEIHRADLSAEVINQIPLKSRGTKRRIEFLVKKFVKWLVHWNTKGQLEFNQSVVRLLGLIAQDLHTGQRNFAALEALLEPVQKLSVPMDRVDRILAAEEGESVSVPVDSGRPLPHGTLEFGVNIAGYLTGEFGLAESARSIIRSLQAVGVPCALNNVEISWLPNLDKTFKDFSETNPYRINLVAVNSDAHLFYEHKGPAYFQGHYNIATWFWESSSFPEEWVSRFADYQEIWVASRFCAESLAKVSPIPVVKMSWPLDMEGLVAGSDRARFGLGESSFVFLFSFDFLSVFERKNPLAVVEAFRNAFSETEDVVLVLKSVNSENDPENLERLKQATAGLNVRVIDARLDREMIRSLFASCDCYVSLHRSEGLGLGLAQSMILGKPVIATAYSGNMDFMNINNSFLVKYTLVELDKDYGPYRKGSVWAEPDIAHATEMMRAVYEDRATAAAVGRRAGEDIRKAMDPIVAGKEMLRRLLRVAAR
jgi:glycosyltransferase involved in cell wall biosynthesis